MAKVLIADDTLFMRKVLSKIVKDLGNTIVAEAGNGDEAYELYKVHKPDIVLLDIVMPPGPKTSNGIDALKLIRGENPDAKIVMISSMGQDSILKETMNIGAKDFVVKPFKTDDVINVLKKYM